jgi:hypothetical protein
MLNFIGAPYGIRTRVSALRGMDPIHACRHLN